jgi:hypothetical protein
VFESKYERLRQTIQEHLLGGEKGLMRLAEDAENLLNQLKDQIRTCIMELQQAEVDVTAIPEGL